MYRNAICAALSCDEREAAVVEEVMRVEVPTLDHLGAGELAGLARRSKRVLDQLRATDPETARFYESQAS